MSVPPETTASLARSKVLSHLENEKGLKVRPVIIPGTGLTAYTMVRKEIPVPLQDQILADLNVIPDFISESMKTVLIVPEKTYIAAIVCSVSVMITAYNEWRFGRERQRSAWSMHIEVPRHEASAKMVLLRERVAVTKPARLYF